VDGGTVKKKSSITSEHLTEMAKSAAERDLEISASRPPLLSRHFRGERIPPPPNRHERRKAKASR